MGHRLHRQPHVRVLHLRPRELREHGDQARGRAALCHHDQPDCGHPLRRGTAARQVKRWGVEWLWRASPGTWLAELYFGQLVAPFGYLYDVELASQITGFKLYWTWRNVIILFAIGTIYRVIAFIGLIYGNRVRL